MLNRGKPSKVGWDKSSKSHHRNRCKATPNQATAQRGWWDCARSELVPPYISRSREVDSVEIEPRLESATTFSLEYET